MLSVRADVRVCFIGDSFVNGTGDPDCLGWAGRLCAAVRRAGHDLTYYNLGVRRETSADIAARWRGEVMPRLPTTAVGRLVFSFGVNDTTEEEGAPRVPLAASLDYLRDILAAAAPRFSTLVVGPPPIADAVQNARIGALSAAFAELCADHAVPYLEVCRPLVQSAVWCAEVAAGDGAHPNAGGYRELAGLVQAWPAWQAWWPAVR